MITIEMKKFNDIIEGLNKVAEKMKLIANTLITLFLNLNLNLSTQLQGSKL